VADLPKQLSIVDRSEDNFTILVVETFVDAVIGIVAYFVSRNSIIEAAAFGEFVHLWCRPRLVTLKSISQMHD
jgi:hypothetical protein